MPWLVIAQSAWMDFGDTVRGVLMFVVVAAVGGTMEIAASEVENRLDESHKDAKVLEDDWYRYLCQASDKKSVVFGYISHLVDGLYFELAMVFALPSFGIGMAVITWMTLQAEWYFVVGSALPGLGSLWFYSQAKHTHVALYKTRRQLASRDPTNGCRRTEEGSRPSLPLGVARDAD
jgi:hypothetical protein